jgi:hypothetical protein
MEFARDVHTVIERPRLILAVSATVRLRTDGALEHDIDGQDVIDVVLQLVDIDNMLHGDLQGGHR